MALLNEIDAIEDRVEPERSFIRDLKVYELEETRGHSSFLEVYKS
jgi:hypothetical protein